MGNKIDTTELTIFISLRDFFFAFISTRPLNILEKSRTSRNLRRNEKVGVWWCWDWEIVKCPWPLWWHICLLGLGNGAAALGN